MSEIDTTRFAELDPSVSRFSDWMNFFMAQGSESKLALCGPRSWAFLTGCFDPSMPYFYRGNAHQRRRHKRYRARMWEMIGSIDHPRT